MNDKFICINNDVIINTRYIISIERTAENNVYIYTNEDSYSITIEMFYKLKEMCDIIID